MIGTRSESGGAVTIWILAMATAALLFTALVVDTSRVLAASTAVGDVADAAGRAAATTVDPITGRIDDPARAVREGQAIIAAAGMTGTVTPSPNEVTASVSQTIDLPLLAILGFGPRTVTETRSTLIDSRSVVGSDRRRAIYLNDAAAIPVILTPRSGRCGLAWFDMAGSTR